MGPYGAFQEVGDVVLDCMSSRDSQCLLSTRRGIDGRNRALTRWLDLQELDCVVGGKVGWLRRASRRTSSSAGHREIVNITKETLAAHPQTWRPAQQFLRSARCRNANSPFGSAAAIFYIFYDNVYEVVAEEEMEQSAFVDLAEKSLGRSTVAKANILSYLQALVEEQEERDFNLLAAASSLEARVDWVEHSKSGLPLFTIIRC